MPTAYQKDTFQALLGLFLQANGRPLPQYSSLKSPSAQSRFLNKYDWPTRTLIRRVRRQVIEQLLRYKPKGRRPWLQIIVDLTTLEKCGKFKAFEHLIHVLHGKRGLHVVILYLVVGPWRCPWGFRVWRGKGSRSPVLLALRLIDTLPQSLTRAYRLMILADTAFGSVSFLKGVRKRRFSTTVGVCGSRCLSDGRQLRHLCHQGQQVYLKDLPFPVTVAWFYLKRDGKLQRRFVLSTRFFKRSTLIWWGKRRWAIEGFFKTAKHRFGLDRFGQGTLLGVYRWLVICLLAFLLAHWVYLSTHPSTLPDWGLAAELALNSLLPEVLACLLLLQLERMRPLLASCGFDVQISCLI